MSNQKPVQAAKKDKTDLHRGMNQRHLTMIGIGGAIGTGFWFASGELISSLGPGGALLLFGLVGAMVYFLMTSLGEIATYVPLSGSFETYASKFIDPALGFAMGWNYYLSWAITVTFEIVVGARILQFWYPPDVLAPWIPSLLFFILLFGLNIISAKGFGESEFWFASIKVAAIIVFLLVGVLMVFGIVPGQPQGGMFVNWAYAAAEGGTGTIFLGGIVLVLSKFIVAAFSFQGTELVGLSAGEAANPEKAIPKAVNAVFWRIVFFYLGGIFLVSVLVPFNDPHLIGADVDWMEYEARVAFSPFTLVFQNAGIHAAAHIMNFVVITAVLSCGNSGLFCATRMLYAMSHEGKAPKFLGKTNRRGVPQNALFVTAGIAAIGFLVDKMPNVEVYDYLLEMSGMMGMFGWLGIALCAWRFRKAFLHQGHTLDELKYKAKFYPYGPILCMVFCVMVILGTGIDALIDWAPVWALQQYLPLPLFLGLYFIYKFYMRTKIVPIDKCDFSSEYKVYKRGDQD
ncbi:MAG: amino acid permease [Clostridiales bacterium]|nr:amino acid permease [Clostridiales bacterium]